MKAISLESLNRIDGYSGSCLVDFESGKVLEVNGNDRRNLEKVGHGNTAVIRAERDMMEFLGVQGHLEDILITLGDHYHILRPIESKGNLFLNVILDRIKANLALARLEIKSFEKSINWD